MGFMVYDRNGNDVTGTREWYADSRGGLYYLTDNTDSPLVEAGDDFSVTFNSIPFV